MKISKRLNWVDWSKSLLIWMMVLGHAGLSGYGREFVYAFHMPAFFIISGYLYKPHNLLKTLKSLGIPILVFSIISLMFYSFKTYIKGDFDILDLLNKCYQPYYKCNFGNYISLFRVVWFIIVLFFMRILLGDIKIFSIIRKYYKYIFFVLLIYMVMEPYLIPQMTSVKYLYIYKVIACMPFMMFGMYIKEHAQQLLYLKNKSLLMMAFLYVCLTFYNGNIDIWSYDFGKSYIICFINAAIASLLLYNLCKKIKNNRVIVLFSTGTLLILGLHDLILQILSMTYNVIHIQNNCLLSSFIIMLICYFLIKIVLKFCPIILGK